MSLVPESRGLDDAFVDRVGVEREGLGCLFWNVKQRFLIRIIEVGGDIAVCVLVVTHRAQSQ